MILFFFAYGYCGSTSCTRRVWRFGILIRYYFVGNRNLWIISANLGISTGAGAIGCSLCRIGPGRGFDTSGVGSLGGCCWGSCRGAGGDCGAGAGVLMGVGNLGLGGGLWVCFSWIRACLGCGGSDSAGAVKGIGGLTATGLSLRGCFRGGSGGLGKAGGGNLSSNSFISLNI